MIKNNRSKDGVWGLDIHTYSCY